MFPFCPKIVVVLSVICCDTMQPNKGLEVLLGLDKYCKIGPGKATCVPRRSQDMNRSVAAVSTASLHWYTAGVVSYSAQHCLPKKFTICQSFCKVCNDSNIT